MTKEVQKQVEDFLDGLTNQELWQLYAWTLKRIHGKVKRVERDRAEFNGMVRHTTSR